MNVYETDDEGVNHHIRAKNGELLTDDDGTIGLKLFDARIDGGTEEGTASFSYITAEICRINLRSYAALSSGSSDDGARSANLDAQESQSEQKD